MKSLKKVFALGMTLSLTVGIFPMVETVQAANTTEAQSFNGHVYQVVTDAKNYEDAELLCELAGAHLATITSAEEQQFIYSLTGKDDVWLGASYKNGTWKWVTGEPFSYTNWVKGQPSNPDKEPYLQFWRGEGEWDDATDRKNSYVMEWESEADFQAQKTKFLNIKSYKGHSYKYFSFSTTWKDAKKYCEKLGGHLVTITSKGEGKFVYNMIDHTKDTWIGMYAKGNGKYAWVTNERTDYLNFGNEVNSGYNGAEKYLGFYDTKSGYGNQWNDFKNDSPNMSFVCEWDNGDNVILTKVNSTLTLKKGSKKSLKYQVFPVKQKVTFTSSNKKVATVTNAGVVKGLRKGTATITIKAGKEKVTVKVKVK